MKMHITMDLFILSGNKLKMSFRSHIFQAVNTGQIYLPKVVHLNHIKNSSLIDSSMLLTGVC